MWSVGSTRYALAALVSVAVCGTNIPAYAGPLELPNGTTLDAVDFERHVAPLLGRMGCNSGSCHGSFQGKGGLRLSLFGHSPGRDYLAMTRDESGRRINRADPDRSLVLLKPTLQTAHEGGRRFRKDSWEYQVLREWIAHGARWTAGTGTIRRIEVAPKELELHSVVGSLRDPIVRPRSDRTTLGRLTVTVEFADGTRADVTPFCEFRAQDDSIVEVSSAGELRALRPGDTAIIVSYRGRLAAARVLVPVAGESAGRFPPEANAIDREVFAKLRRLNIVPSELAGDAAFLRRVTIDTIGCLPAPDEVRAFLADDRPDKRARKIDELLHHPLHAALWATKFCDATASNLDALEGPDELKPKRARMWHDWFRRRVAENVPYHEIVRGVLCATSRDRLPIGDWIEREVRLVEQAKRGFETGYADRPALDLFWRRREGDEFFPLEKMAELTASAFLGVRIECAQCHKHPFDRWTQADYRAWANVFSQVRFGSSPELRAAMFDLLEQRRRSAADDSDRKPIPRLQEVYLDDRLRRLSHPETGGPLAAKALGGPEIDLDALEGDARARLFEWLVRPDNPYFARSFVNRVWAHYFGSGLVEPVDAFSVANPPSNERLLEGLADDFIEHGYDIRRLERLILSSRTYQVSAVPNETNAGDRTNFSRAYVRPLPAEVALDVLNSALGVTEEFGPDAPANIHAIEVAPSRLRNARVMRFFRVFGRPERTTTCECERASEPGVRQTLLLMSDEAVLQKIRDGRLKRLLAAERSDRNLVEELFLATLSRFATSQETEGALEHVARKTKETNRQAALADIVWALVNTREFITNH